MADRVMTYLACPYSHPDPAVREERWHAANRAAAALMRAGALVYSPISEGHGIASDGGVPGDWEYWQAVDRAHLSISNRVVVLRLDGWEKSTGIRAELAIAAEAGIPVEYIDPEAP